jgi:hypothetical protein
MKIAHFDKSDIIEELQQGMAGGRIKEGIPVEPDMDKIKAEIQRSNDERRTAHRAARPWLKDHPAPDLMAPPSNPNYPTDKRTGLAKKFDFDEWNRLAKEYPKKYAAHHYPDDHPDKPVDETGVPGEQPAQGNPINTAMDKIGAFTKAHMAPSAPIDKDDVEVDERALHPKYIFNPHLARRERSRGNPDAFPSSHPSFPTFHHKDPITDVPSHKKDKLNIDARADEILSKVLTKWVDFVMEEPLNEISQGERRRREQEAKHAASEKARLDKEAAVANDARIAKKQERRQDKIGKKFGDLIQKQGQVQQAEPTVKKEPVSIPFHGWEIKYRPAEKPGDPVSWIVNRNGQVRHKGESPTDKDAVGDAEEWIKQGAGQSGKFTNNATIDFNKKFVQEFAPGGQTFYATNVIKDGQPHFVFSQEPFKGLQRSSIRAGVDFPSISERPTAAQAVGLKPHGRYIIDVDNAEELEGTPGVFMFPLIFQGIIQDKSERMHMPGPGFTVAHPRDKGGVSVAGETGEVDEKIDPWHGYTADDPKAGALAKAPKTTMNGVPTVPFSELVQDTIRAHGVKHAFQYYVIKNGLPPRLFQIYAGLTADPPGKDRGEKMPLPEPKPMQKVKQSWWQKLLGKLEE